MRRMPGAPVAQRLLFGIGAFWAILSVPLFVFQTVTGTAVFAGPGFLFHGREMFLGYLAPIIAGYLRPRLRATWLSGLVAAWLVGRITAFIGPHAWRIAADLLLAAVFAAAVTPPLLRGAKKWRNRALPMVLICLALLAASFFASGTMQVIFYPVLLPVLAVALSLLLLFMGGRILVPLFRGHANRRGWPRAAGLQPRLEGLLIGLCVACALVLAAGWRRGAGALAVAAGVAGAARIARWQPWRHRDRPDLLAMLAGQAWTLAALGLFGVAWASGQQVGAPALHVLTIGGVGSMTAMVMSLALLRGSRVIRIWVPMAGILMSGSLGFRIVASLPYPGRSMSLVISVCLWSLTWAGVLAVALIGHAQIRRE